MMRKINLLENAPAVKRKIDVGWRTEKNRKIARRFDKEFFDGDRVNGYGGYVYDGRWKHVAQRLKDIYNVDSDSSFLDIGCAKGFLLYDLREQFRGISVAGIDISKYAINHAMDGFGKYIKQKNLGIRDTNDLEQTAKKSVLPFMIKGCASSLPYADKSFDIVVSINTLHNLSLEDCKKAVAEMVRVGRGNSMFIQVDSYQTKKQKRAIEVWNLTAKTVLPPEEWLSLFEQAGYKGDYFWTLINPE